MDKIIKRAKCLSVLGTGSDVGKSIVVTALCRIFRDSGISVAPFKAQNMSNNSFVTPLGGEMGRAQIVQAQAAGVEPHVDMNPVLLKPCADIQAQIILHGKPVSKKKAAECFSNADYLFRKAMDSLERLRSVYDLVVIEGAGSCAEVNLRNRDFVNFPTAHAADGPVILVADIDRGGVFAQIVGTLALISEKERQSVQGIVINRFRGDRVFFEEGIAFIEKETGLPVLGLIPFFRHIQIDSEDGLPLDVLIDPTEMLQQDKINIAVIRLPHISNFTDFNLLECEPNVSLRYLANPRSLNGYEIVILPGTKNVRSDMDWLQETGWVTLLKKHVENSGKIGGICGGYQMLGKSISDPDGVEGEPGQLPGLGFLDIETTLHGEKVVCHSTGIWNISNERVEGYEIHNGVTTRGNGLSSAIRVTSRNNDLSSDCDGAISSNGHIWGTYFHGIFDTPQFRRSFLRSIKPEFEPASDVEMTETTESYRDRQYRLLADHFRSHLDISKILNMINIRKDTPVTVLEH